MLANQIVNQNFTATGKGGVKATEVVSHLEKVAEEYSKLQKENARYKERLAAITPIIDEYNENKSAIATILISSQKEADKILSAAKKESEALLDDAKIKADKYAYDRKEEAEALYNKTIKEKEAELKKVTNDLEKLKSDIVTLSEKYVFEINKKAKEIIDAANEKAKKHIADACAEIENVERKAEASLAESKSRLNKLNGDISVLKAKAQSICSAITEKLNEVETVDADDFEIDIEDDFEADEIDFSQISDFSINISAESDESVVSSHMKNEFTPYFSTNSAPDVNIFTPDMLKGYEEQDESYASFGSSVNEDILKGTAISLEDVKIEDNE